MKLLDDNGREPRVNNAFVGHEDKYKKMRNEGWVGGKVKKRVFFLLFYLQKE